MLTWLFWGADFTDAFTMSQRSVLGIVDRLPGHLRPDNSAVFAPQAKRHLVAPASLQGRTEGPAHPASVRFVDNWHRIIRQGHQLFYRVAGNPVHSGIRPERPAFRPDPDLPEVAVVRNRAEALL